MMRKLMQRRTMLAVAALAVLAIAGCATLGRVGFQQPIVNFKDLRVRGLGLTGGSLDAYLNVYNPNGYRLDATRLTYTVTVGDNAQLGTGALDSRFTVQNNDSTTVRIPIDFTYSGIGAAARQIMQSGSVPYNVKGDLTVGTPVGNFTVPYSGTGRFSAFGGAQNNPQ
ncbi:MAG TPA: LEA type 2 family protein [Gemmatimonadaceae bacterium]|nr:LEA type 2 family protein [Gemmatimonadaceae bacterium]